MTDEKSDDDHSDSLYIPHPMSGGELLKFLAALANNYSVLTAHYRSALYGLILQAYVLVMNADDDPEFGKLLRDACQANRGDVTDTMPLSTAVIRRMVSPTDEADRKKASKLARGLQYLVKEAKGADDAKRLLEQHGTAGLAELAARKLPKKREAGSNGKSMPAAMGGQRVDAEDVATEAVGGLAPEDVDATHEDNAGGPDDDECDWPAPSDEVATPPAVAEADEGGGCDGDAGGAWGEPDDVDDHLFEAVPVTLMVPRGMRTDWATSNEAFVVKLKRSRRQDQQGVVVFNVIDVQ